jgi:hypothetical protein
MQSGGLIPVLILLPNLLWMLLPPRGQAEGSGSPTSRLGALMEALEGNRPCSESAAPDRV